MGDPAHLWPAMLCLAEQETRLDATTQRRLVDFATRHGSVPVLAALARRADLDPVLDGELARVERAEVRAAWLARPGRSSTEILAALERETRERVLTAVARIPDLPEEVAAFVVSHCRGPQPLAALVASDGTSDTVRKTALLELGKRPGKLNSEQTEAVRELISGAPEVRRAVLRSATRADFLSLALRAAGDELDTECGEWLIGRLVLDVVGGIGTSEGELRDSTGHALINAAETARRVLDSVTGLEDLRARVVAELEPFETASWSSKWQHEEFSANLTSLRSKDSICGRTVEELYRTATGPDKAAALNAVRHLLDVPYGDEVARRRASALCSELAHSGKLHLDVLEELVRDRWNVRASLLAAGNLPVRIGVVIAQRARVDDKWAALAATCDPDAALEALLSDPDTETDTLLAMVNACPEPKIVARLPAKVLVQSSSTHPEATAAAAQLAIDRLGDDQDRWELFAELQYDSEVPLGELLDLVEAGTAG